MKYRDPHYCPHCHRGPMWNPGAFMRHVYVCEKLGWEERSRLNIVYARRKHREAQKRGAR